MHKVNVVFEDMRLPSMNKIWSNKSIYQRRQIMNQYKLLMRSKIDPNTAHWFIKPVIIKVIAYYRHPAVDADNLMVKPLIDAMRGFFFRDDDPRFVAEIRLQSRTALEDKIVIEIQEV